MYLPNPLAIGALKAIAYGAFGGLVRRFSARPGNLFGFAAVRVLGGWGAGLVFFAALAALANQAHPSDRQLLLYSAPVRFLVWALLLYAWFRPKGGIAALALWSLLATLLSTAIDLTIFHFVNDVSWLRIAWC
jgi:uncharacterized membrane protein